MQIMTVLICLIDIGLTEQALVLIDEMRLKHEAEIYSLSKQLNLDLEFVKVRYYYFNY